MQNYAKCIEHIWCFNIRDTPVIIVKSENIAHILSFVSTIIEKYEPAMIITSVLLSVCSDRNSTCI